MDELLPISAENDSKNMEAKKRYQSPELLEWGSLASLTLGPALAPKDFPLGGGTRQT